MAFLGTGASLLQDITLVILWVGAGLNLVGVHFGRTHQTRRHFYTMVLTAATVLLFLSFYLARVMIEGATKFPGPDSVRGSVYVPLLIVHACSAIATVALLVYVVTLALSDLQRVDGQYVLALQPGKARYHHRFATPFRILWVTTAVTGTTVYLFLFVLY